MVDELTTLENQIAMLEHQLQELYNAQQNCEAQIVDNKNIINYHKTRIQSLHNEELTLNHKINELQEQNNNLASELNKCNDEFKIKATNLHDNQIKLIELINLKIKTKE